MYRFTGGLTVQCRLYYADLIQGLPASPTEQELWNPAEWALGRNSRISFQDHAATAARHAQPMISSKLEFYFCSSFTTLSCHPKGQRTYVLELLI